MRTKIDVHQHLWSEPLLGALAAREELPFVRRERELTILYLAGERPYVIDVSAEASGSRALLVESDGLDRALICISSPLGIESLPREQALELIGAFHTGALAGPGQFGVWGAVPLARPEPADVDEALDRGCLGISLPAGAMASVGSLTRLAPVLARIERRDVPLFVHPGPGPERAGEPTLTGETSLGDPLWWPALTRYVAGMHAAWLAFATGGRTTHPRLRVIFAMLAGLAPLQHERLSSRGGPGLTLRDPLVFYDTASYGPAAVAGIAELVGVEQILYGSDRPVVEPAEHGMPAQLDWDAVTDATDRAFAPAPRPSA